MAAHMRGFFKAPATQAHPQAQNYEAINVGGGQFCSAAVALIDYYQNGVKIDEEAGEKIFACLDKFFPQYRSSQGINERMKRLFNNPNPEFVESLACVQQQLAVDEFFKDPLNLDYRDMVKQLSADTPKSYLRDPHTRLPICALKALEKAIGIRISLSFTTRDKELRRLDRSVDSAKPALMIEVHEDKFYPKVKHKASFASVGQWSVTIKLVMPNEQEGTLAEILAEITADNQRLLHSYKQQRKTILSQGQDTGGDVDYTQLRDLFIALLPQDENNAAFIIQLEPSKSTPECNNVLLAKTLASWIVAGAIKADDLYDRMENSQAATLSR